MTSASRKAMSPEPHDFIYLEIRNYDHLRGEIASLYKSGLSLRDIEKRMSLSKTKIRDLLLRAGVPLRSLEKSSMGASVRSQMKWNIKPPYGFWYVEGLMQPHPEEYPVLLGIIRRWKSGDSLNSIATRLNDKAVPSPMGKQWSWNSINNIIQRVINKELVERNGKYELK
ncbi:MAG: recombinase family protein [Bdellovibrio sp.]